MSCWLLKTALMALIMKWFGEMIDVLSDHMPSITYQYNKRHKQISKLDPSRLLVEENLYWSVWKKPSQDNI